MKTERVIRLLQVEKDYTLKQTGHSQQPINKEVAEALDIAIGAVKQSENYISKDTYDAWLKSVKAMAEADLTQVVRCKDCKYSRNMPLGLCYLHTEPCNNPQGYKGEAVCVEPDDFCSYGERKTDDE